MNHLTSKQTPTTTITRNGTSGVRARPAVPPTTSVYLFGCWLLVFPKQTRREKLTAELRLHRAVKGRLIVTAAGQVTSLISCFTQKSNTFAPQELDTCDSNDNRHTGGRDAGPKYQLLLACWGGWIHSLIASPTASDIRCSISAPSASDDITS